VKRSDLAGMLPDQLFRIRQGARDELQRLSEATGWHPRRYVLRARVDAVNWELGERHVQMVPDDVTRLWWQENGYADLWLRAFAAGERSRTYGSGDSD